jgi:hypothetical protein
LAILFASLSIIIGCASIDYSNYRQAVMVTSIPEGLEVYDGDRLVGTTPGVMRVRRRHHPHLRFKMKDGSFHDLDLKTNYRWGRSGALNLLLWTSAPYGWLTDWATGTAWRIEDPQLQNFQGGEPVQHTPVIVAVAPPPASDPEMSDLLGKAIESRLRESSKFIVLPYAKTVPDFEYYGWSGGARMDREDRNRLYYDLKSDHILQSDAEEKDGIFHVTAKLKDIYTDQTANTYQWEITPVDNSIRGYRAKNRIFTYFSLIPNTAFLNFTNYTPNLTIDEVGYEGKEKRSDEFGTQALSYISAFSLAHLERPRRTVRGQWTFGLVPTLIVSKKTIEFPSYEPVRGVDFERLYVSGGYGPEVGYLCRYGFSYFDFIPAVTYTSLDYASSEVSGTLARWSVQWSVEVGHQYFITEHLVAKVFGRGLQEDNELWQEAFSHVASREIRTQDLTSAFAGISIGYYFPSSVKLDSKMRVR